MSELRVMTRLIPEGSVLVDFPPLPDHAVLVSRNVKVSQFTDPSSGMNYKREDIYESFNIVPGVSAEMADEVAVKSLEKAGFRKLEENKTTVAPEGISFQVSVPKVISLEDMNPVCVSVVDNKEHFCSSKKPDEFAEQQKNDECSTSSTDVSSKTLCKSNYPSYKMKKCNNSSKLKYKFKTASSSQED